jgi:nucleotide-binding universal stress UspA family protein
MEGSMRIENILVPVDFAPPSRLALNYGIALARKCRARLTLLHILESGAMLNAGFPAASDEKEHRDQALRMLAALVGPEDQDDLDLRIVLKTGDVQDEIAATIAEHHADMLVMGAHGRGLLGRWLIGSVTQSMLRKVHIPVLTVCHAVKPLTFQRILFATDLSAASKGALGFVFEFARMTRSELVIFHALEPINLTYGGNEMVDYVTESNRKEAQSRLADLAAEARRHAIKVETVLVEGPAAREILKAAESNDVDLILMTIQSKGLIERTFLGATAEHIVRDAHVPVFSIPAGIGAGEEQMAGLQRARE